MLYSRPWITPLGGIFVRPTAMQWDRADYAASTMTRESVRDRHRKLVESDWHTAGRLRIQSLDREDRPVSK
jgi:hypothetical protein